VRASSARSRQCLVSLMGTFATVKDPAAAHGWCPLCPENRQIADCFGMSALCQSRLNALHKKHRYSITSSALACNVRGTVMPSVFAALRLITSSNLVARMIGRSAGLSPLRIRPT
jgi:hypothetical protein